MATFSSQAFAQVDSKDSDFKSEAPKLPDAIDPLSDDIKVSDELTADAGGNQSVNMGTRVTLNGSKSSGSKSDYKLSYFWQQSAGPTVNLTGHQTANPIFISPIGLTKNTDLMFSLFVLADVEGKIAKSLISDVKVTVLPTVNLAENPVADAGKDREVGENTRVTLDGSNSSTPVPGRIIQSYKWVKISGPAVQLTGADSAVATFTTPAQLAIDTPFVFALTVTSLGSSLQVLQHSSQVTITALAGVNDPPTARIAAQPDAGEGQEVTLDGSISTDPENESLTYIWTQTAGPSATLKNANTARLSFTTPRQLVNNAQQTFKLIVRDSLSRSNDDASAASVTVTTVAGGNDAPVARVAPGSTVAPGVNVVLDGSGSSDPEGEELTYIWTQTGGTVHHLQNANTAKPTFVTPLLQAVEETFTYHLQVVDSRNAKSPSSANPTAGTTVTITVTASPPVQAAQVLLVTTNEVKEGGGGRTSKLYFTVTMVDEDGQKSDASVGDKVTSDHDRDTAKIVNPPVSSGTPTTPVTTPSQRRGGSIKVVTVKYADLTQVSGTATVGEDYVRFLAGELTFQPGETEKRIPVTINDDNIDEFDETIVLRFYDPVNASLPLQEATGTIGDDDRAGVTVSTANITLTENVALGDEYTVVLTSQPTHSVTITPVIDSQNATVSGPLTFLPARWNIPQTVFVKPINDEIDNWPRPFNITNNISSTDPKYNSFAVAAVNGVINDDDLEPVISIDAPSLVEGNVGENKTLTFTASLNKPSGKEITVAVWKADNGGTASTGIDYERFTDTKLTFAPGETSKSFNVTIIGDALDEPDETLRMNLSNEQNVTVATRTNLGTVVDNDDPPNLVVNEPRVVEGPKGRIGAGIFTVSLDNPSGKEISVNYADTKNGSAISDVDYQAIDPGRLIFRPGVVTQPLRFFFRGDDVDEEEETITLRFSNPVNVVFNTGDAADDATADATISDDDTAGVTTSKRDIDLVENAAGTYTVRLNSQPTHDVTITLATNSAFANVTDRLIFTPLNWNSPQTVTVTPVNDDIDKPIAPVTITHTISSRSLTSSNEILSLDANYNTLASVNVTANITNDDAVGVTISKTSLTMTESTTGSYTIRLNSEPTGQVTVHPSSSSLHTNVPERVTFTPVN
ncbi:hypothetical protein N9E91_01885 [Alphaproteobacteria bacterium]|nr:hypothetical protein [Alphaproteobacteria bacterium]